MQYYQIPAGQRFTRLVELGIALARLLHRPRREGTDAALPRDGQAASFSA